MLQLHALSQVLLQWGRDQLIAEGGTQLTHSIVNDLAAELRAARRSCVAEDNPRNQGGIQQICFQEVDASRAAAGVRNWSGRSRYRVTNAG